MGFLRRLLGSQPEPAPEPIPNPAARPPLFDLGDQRGERPTGGFALASGPGMNVGGESHYRDVIAAIAGGTRTEAIKLVTWATLVPDIGSAEKQANLLDRALDGKTATDISAPTPALAPGRGHGPGMVRGRPHFECHVAEVKRLEQVGDEPAAEALLLEICDATEAESQRPRGLAWLQPPTSDSRSSTGSARTRWPRMSADLTGNPRTAATMT